MEDAHWLDETQSWELLLSDGADVVAVAAAASSRVASAAERRNIVKLCETRGGRHERVAVRRKRRRGRSAAEKSKSCGVRGVSVAVNE